MELFSKLLILFTSFYLGISYVIEYDEPGYSLLWPTEYHFGAEKFYLHTEVIETYKVWYSAEENRSRIDFYDGTVRRYYQIDPNNKTLVYQISPITTDVVTNEMICRTMGDEDESSIDNLPSVDDFVYQGNETLDGKVVQVWKSVEEDDDRIERTLYVYRDDRGFDVPVRYEDIQYNTWIKGMEEHTITNFYDFQTIVSPEDLDVGKVEECQDLGKLGENLKIDLDFLHPVFSRDVHKAFQSYKKHFNKKHRESEHRMRRAIFEENWKLVVAHNRKNLSYKLEVNKFADRLDEELGHLTATRPSPPGAVGTYPYPYSEKDLLAMVDQLPIYYDMTFDGVISRVKNQGSCGSCWAFATVAAVEGALARSNGGRVFDLSEQSLVDCAWGDNFGCSGGQIDGAFKYVYTNGIPSEKNYGPYLQQDGFCKLENMTAVHGIRGYAKVPSLSETAMRAALYNFAPVTVLVLAGKHMKFYSSGVFYDIDCVKGEYNHAVAVVGYGVRDGVRYWIMKNSWGEDWGQDGYILMSSTNDNCNVMAEAYYPIV